MVSLLQCRLTLSRVRRRRAHLLRANPLGAVALLDTAVLIEILEDYIFSQKGVSHEESK